MGILTRALGDHLKEVAWAFFLIFFIIGCVYLIFGRHLGYENIIWICLGFAAIVLGVFMMIILGELLWLVILKVFKYFNLWTDLGFFAGGGSIVFNLWIQDSFPGPSSSPNRSSLTLITPN